MFLSSECLSVSFSEVDLFPFSLEFERRQSLPYATVFFIFINALPSSFPLLSTSLEFLIISIRAEVEHGLRVTEAILSTF